MARWRLMAAHYLNIPGTNWEYKEVNRTTGKQERRVFDVPTLVDPENPGDWTNRFNQDSGETCVCDGANPQRGDLIFKGPPTPDMHPLDPEAEAISSQWRKKWQHPIEGLATTFSESLLDNLQKQVAEIQSQGRASAPTEGMTELLTAMTAMMKQNAELIAALTQRPAAERRA